MADARASTGDSGDPRKNPDYLIEGHVFDCYSPTPMRSVRNIWSTVQQKIEGREIVAPAAQEEAPQVVDLTEALKRSLEEVKARSGGSKKASGE